MLAQITQSFFCKKTPYQIFSWPTLHKKITCAVLANCPQTNFHRKIIYNFVWVYLGQSCTRKLPVHVGPLPTDNFYEENSLYNVGLTHLVQSQVTKMKLKGKYYASKKQPFEKLFLRQSLKLVSAIFYQISIFSPNDSPSKTMKNLFYFI